MAMSIDVTDDSLIRNFKRMRKQLPRELDVLAATTAAVGKEFARDIITVVIYATPERGGYRRTQVLTRSIYSAVERDQDGFTVIVGASANYAAYNELGTYDGYAGDGIAEEQIIDAARASMNELITLEYGDVEKGLEPRPYILPAIVMVERAFPELLREMLARLTQR